MQLAVPERSHLAQIEPSDSPASQRSVFQPSARNVDQTQFKQLGCVMTRHAVSDGTAADVLKRHELRLSQFANCIRNFAHCHKPFRLIEHEHLTGLKMQELYQMFHSDPFFELLCIGRPGRENSSSTCPCAEIAVRHALRLWRGFVLLGLVWGVVDYHSERDARLFGLVIWSGGDLLSHVLRRSTIGATGLNGRVRDGIGCFPRAVTTRPGKRSGRGALPGSGCSVPASVSGSKHGVRSVRGLSVSVALVVRIVFALPGLGGLKPALRCDGAGALFASAG